MVQTDDHNLLQELNLNLAAMEGDVTYYI